MSNKLKKTSAGYSEALKNLRDRVNKEGGLNIVPDLMKEYTEIEDENKAITEDEFFDICAKLSDEGFHLYKICQICKGKETRGLMLCSSDTVVAFTQTPKEEKRE